MIRIAYSFCAAADALAAGNGPHVGQGFHGLGMTFIHPLLAWGTLLGAIPIIIHILSRRRYRILRWAATDFLLSALSQRSRNLRIQDLILLALRTLALVVAALVVARPLLSPAAAKLARIASRGPDAVIVLDTSYSMGTNVAGRTRMASARHKARAVLASLPQRSRVGVIYMDERVSRATDGLVADRTRIGAAIDAARATATGTDAPPAFAAALEMLKGSTAPSKRVYLVTDAQARAFDQTAGALRQMLAEADPSIGFVVLTTDNRPVANLAITDLAVKSRWLHVGTPVQFDAQLQDVGDPPAREVVTFKILGAQFETGLDCRDLAQHDRSRIDTSEPHPDQLGELDVRPGKIGLQPQPCEFQHDQEENEDDYPDDNQHAHYRRSTELQQQLSDLRHPSILS